ncbi:MAG: 50S ribosomal protein L5 [Candidatus Magasanikbacteria bacterium CG_4_10_14_0_2_um_filter_37_12]|uniref:Large ribosomal subunit protein uL5 n=1 Tax=Candidatus Magasanikbacteria bacterium CG_4_10_14_0_2_um_filter_37_12 TaxID=1974637 RepID=A0A2M7V8N8_9BACT|nr:MAG: 50S ribosomal protein L5 [Candidatus Magasanikbacteria bacterium CG_4_10_14_0_2_um_filter_37_12]
MKSELYKQYKDEVVPVLKEKFGYQNVMQVPRIEKVVLNVGYGRHTKDSAYIENVGNTLRVITGQAPVHNKAKKSISNFKVREGSPVGVSVTLRGEKMYDFLQKLVSITFPRVRDFRGIDPNSFDKQGNYAVGFKENVAFPEISVGSLDKVHGLEVIIRTTAIKKEEGLELLKGLGFPFKQK